MRFNQAKFEFMIGQLRQAVSSGSSIMQKDDGMGQPITKQQFLHIIDTLSEGFKPIWQDLEDLKREIDHLKSINK